MKLSFSTIGCPDYDWSDICSCAKDFGFKGIEIRGLGENIFNAKSRPFSDDNILATVEKLKRLRLEIPCLSTGCSLQYADKRDETIAEIKKYIDLAQILSTPYIRILGDRIKRVHVKDFKTPVGNIMGFVPLLAGNVNYPEVMKALNEIGYDKWITSEVSPSMYYPEYTIYATAMAMDYIIGNR